jgi:hypothetical protein
LKLRSIDQATTLSFGVPLNAPETDSQPVVCSSVSLRVDSGAVHRESPFGTGGSSFLAA